MWYCSQPYNIATPKKKGKKKVGIANSINIGDSVVYYDGGKEHTIKQSMLKEIKSSVITHEGQHLLGRDARRYMDKYSSSMLKKNLEGSYNSTSIQGRV